MDRKALRAFNADALKALEGIAAEHGMSLRPGTHRFTNANATLKFELSDITTTGEVLTPEAQAFKLHASRYGLSPDDLYGTFISRGTQFRITGLKTRRPKFPISAQNVATGRLHKFTENALRNTTITQKGVGRRAAHAAQKERTAP